MWWHMMHRCYNKKCSNYKHYGGRGIDVYDKWHDDKIFAEEIVGLIGERPTKEYSLDRIDNDKGYYPNNIRWATQKQQTNNTRYSHLLTANRLSIMTGYSRERIRQLTYPTTSSLYTKDYPLKDFVDKIIKSCGRTHYIYKPETIEFLLDKRNNWVNNR